MKTKQLVMTSAHAIFKMQNVTFSEALIEAWKAIKSGLKAVILKLNKLVKSVGLGYETVYFEQLLYINIAVKRETVNNAGAVHWYDGKTFNND